MTGECQWLSGRFTATRCAGVAMTGECQWLSGRFTTARCAGVAMTGKWQWPTGRIAEARRAGRERPAKPAQRFARAALRCITIPAIVTAVAIRTMMIVASALISGVTPSLTFE